MKGSFGMGGRTFKCSTSHYICSQVSKFRDPWNNMTVGCFNAPAPHIPSWTNADTAGLFSFMFMSNQLSSITQASNNSCNSLTEGAISKMSSAYSTTNDLGNNDRRTGMECCPNRWQTKRVTTQTLPNSKSDLEGGREYMGPLNTREAVLQPIL